MSKKIVISRKTWLTINILLAILLISFFTDDMLSTAAALSIFALLIYASYRIVSYFEKKIKKFISVEQTKTRETQKSNKKTNSGNLERVTAGNEFAFTETWSYRPNKLSVVTVQEWLLKESGINVEYDQLIQLYESQDPNFFYDDPEWNWFLDKYNIPTKQLELEYQTANGLFIFITNCIKERKSIILLVDLKNLVGTENDNNKEIKIDSWREYILITKTEKSKEKNIIYFTTDKFYDGGIKTIDPDSLIRSMESRILVADTDCLHKVQNIKRKRICCYSCNETNNVKTAKDTIINCKNCNQPLLSTLKVKTDT